MTTTEPTTDWGRGDWMQTFTGRAFYPLDPKPEDVDVADIAHALSLICRYGGHTTRFYSVAEHCVLVSKALDDNLDDAIGGLLHDAAEAYIGDMVRPLKNQRSMRAYRDVDVFVTGAIIRAFDITGPILSPAVKAADNRILLDERAELLTAPPQDWEQEGLEPLGVRVQGWYPPAAERQWRTRFNELMARREEERS